MNATLNKRKQISFPRRWNEWISILIVAVGGCAPPLKAQSSSASDLAQQIQALTQGMALAQKQLEQSQRQLEEMRRQLTALQIQVAVQVSPPAASGSPVAHVRVEDSPAPAVPSAETASSTTADISEIRETQAVQAAQIAVHEQSKVESESKYSIKISGLLLFNAYSNSTAVDSPTNPTYSSAGKGTVGASVRQTLLGVEAQGPHLLGAGSRADLQVDFFANPGSGSTSGNYSPGYSTSPAVLRLRTLHATLNWTHTAAYFNLDRPIVSPDVPHSLTAVGVPEFAWAGNLWTWNPQAGITHDQRLSSSLLLRLQAALLDVGDAPLNPALYTSFAGPAASSAEASRRLSSEARIALVGSRLDQGAHVGIGGYFSPHVTSDGRSFDAWAGTIDYRIPLAHRVAFTGTAYRGLALGGLGGGVYKDYLYRALPDGTVAFRPLDDVGGWGQLQAKLNERVELNAGFGVDEGFAREIRPFLTSSTSSYQSLSRNRAASTNVIYSPSAYLLFSLEYRRLDSLHTDGSASKANVFGLAAGYRF